MERIANRLKSASTCLAKVPSMAYAIAYLLCIPLFAFMYWIQSDSFYHSTVQFEKTLDADADVILKEIKSEIANGFKEKHGDFIAFEGDWGLWISNISLASLKPDAYKTSFNMRLRFVGRNKLDGVESVIPVGVTVNENSFVGQVHPGHQSMQYYKEVSLDNSQTLPVNAKFIFPLNIPGNSLSKELQDKAVWLPMSQELHSRVVAFHSSAKGFPADASGSFGRMLYLSAVTITTLGYGDIVPITNGSRFFVGLESVLGIVLIGLFLNSLSREHDNA